MSYIALQPTLAERAATQAMTWWQTLLEWIGTRPFWAVLLLVALAIYGLGASLYWMFAELRSARTGGSRPKARRRVRSSSPAPDGKKDA
jgi:hypothetical protein